MILPSWAVCRAEHVSRGALVLVLVLLAANVLLISPPEGQTYPGARPWGELSILRALTELMSLHGAVATVRGVEIKEFAFHLAAAAGLLVLGIVPLISNGRRRPSPAARAARYAQILLGIWVAVALLTSLSSGDARMSAHQALLYAFGLAWALALATTLERRDVPQLALGLVITSVAAAVLAIWYYYERNPFHRVGFPIGNPTTLAASVVPAILVCLGRVGLAVRGTTRERRVPDVTAAVLALAALVPLGWCLALTRGRGAVLALLVGVAALAIYLARGRLRRVLALTFGLGVVLAGVGLYYGSRLDVTMGRGATVRFRLYAWRYAAELWSAKPFSGHGAACYPRLAGALADADRALDPGAFLGAIVEHAHNELFEILAEVGLGGGVTFVGGYVATFLGALLVLRPRAPPGERWLYAALVAGLAALLADSLVGVALRLPGVPAVFYTLLGVTWALCRTDGAPVPSPAPENPSPTPPRLELGRFGSAALVVCALAGVACIVVAVRGWGAVRQEHAGYRAFEREEYAAALADLDAAEAGLLDPVSLLAARDMALQCRFHLAEQAVAELAGGSAAATQAAWERVVERAAATYGDAVSLLGVAPALQRTDAVAGRTAEFLALLDDGVARRREAHRWRQIALQHWQRQRQRTPYDVETLLALTSYRPSTQAHIGLLRNALRALSLGDVETVRNASQRDRWYAAWVGSLRDLVERPDFDAQLAAFRAGAGPITPATDVDALLVSMAPEIHRLTAAVALLRGDPAAAAEDTRRAIALYEPVRPRFPYLYPTALAERADYLLLADPNRAAESAGLLERAMAALPVIQAQKYEQSLRPYRLRLIRARLAAGNEAAARDALRALGVGDDDLDAQTALAYVDLAEFVLRHSAGYREKVRGWLAAALRIDPDNLHAWSWRAWLAAEAGDAATVEAVLAEARTAGLAEAGIAVIRRSLAQEYPALRDALTGSD